MKYVMVKPVVLDVTYTGVIETDVDNFTELLNIVSEDDTVRVSIDTPTHDITTRYMRRIKRNTYLCKVFYDDNTCSLVAHKDMIDMKLNNFLRSVSITPGKHEIELPDGFDIAEVHKFFKKQSHLKGLGYKVKGNIVVVDSISHVRTTRL